MNPLMVDGLPEHCPIGVDADGHGPVDESEPDFDHLECWCRNGQLLPCPVEVAQLAVMARAEAVLARHYLYNAVVDDRAEGGVLTTCQCGALLETNTPECHRAHITAFLVAHALLAVNTEWGVATAGRATAVQDSWADAEQVVMAADQAGGPKTAVVTRLVTSWDLPFTLPTTQD